MSRDDGGYLARQPSAVDSAFAVLETVARLGPGVTGRELVTALPMSKATVYRIIKHMVEQEYLVRTPDLTGFMLGRRVLDLAGGPADPGGGTPGGRSHLESHGSSPQETSRETADS